MLATVGLVLVGAVIIGPIALGFLVMGAIMLATVVGSFVSMIRFLFDEKLVRSRGRQALGPQKPAWV